MPLVAIRGNFSLSVSTASWLHFLFQVIDFAAEAAGLDYKSGDPLDEYRHKRGYLAVTKVKYDGVEAVEPFGAESDP